MMKWENMFGGPLDAKTEAEIARYDWRYKTLDSDASNSVVIDLLHRLEGRSFSIAGENTGRWQKGWQENFEDFRRTDDLKALEPKYLRPAKVLRLDGQFIEPADPMFEANWYRVFRGWFARRYLSGFDHIYEFGCGSGHNLVFLAQEFPGKHIHGYDWAEASFRIIDRLRSHFPNIGGGRFDFFEPHTFRPFMPNSAVLTIGAEPGGGLSWSSCAAASPRCVFTSSRCWNGTIPPISSITRRSRSTRHGASGAALPMKLCLCASIAPALAAFCWKVTRNSSGRPSRQRASKPASMPWRVPRESF
jgi:hypothetical protein